MAVASVQVLPASYPFSLRHTAAPLTRKKPRSRQTGSSTVTSVGVRASSPSRRTPGASGKNGEQAEVTSSSSSSQSRAACPQGHGAVRGATGAIGGPLPPPARSPGRGALRAARGLGEADSPRRPLLPPRGVRPARPSPLSGLADVIGRRPTRRPRPPPPRSPPPLTPSASGGGGGGAFGGERASV
ncbi:hypothetical protein P7K49_010904 [Saguinus oedipus]|uniref:Uncharacterized protein n=1 Tax=Saguinus oedipus TaxID=9490 RepID=A0ABQ9VRF1_SAGOE|nr:hypothetical protein P7K49_010904 [Saguinus oedipus]